MIFQIADGDVDGVFNSDADLDLDGVPDMDPGIDTDTDPGADPEVLPNPKLHTDAVADSDAVAASSQSLEENGASAAKVGKQRQLKKPICDVYGGKGPRVDPFWGMYELQSCVSGRCVDGQCVCTALYTGDTCGRPIQMSSRRGSPLERWKLPYRGDVTLAKDNVGEGTKYRSIMELDIKGEPPRFIGPVGPPLIRNLPETDVMRGKKIFFSRCAVVGSSGAMLAAERGAEIDEHDLVMRFNNAPTVGFEIYVGRKTTHRVSNSLSFNFREGVGEHVMQVMRSPQAFKQFIAAFNREDERLKRTTRGGAAKDKRLTIRLYALHVDFARYLAESFHFTLSVGFQGILASLMSCEEVDVYGFAAGPAQGYAHHYWSPTDHTTFNTGRDTKEWNALRSIAALGLVQLRDGCIEECHRSQQQCTSCTLTGMQEQMSLERNSTQSDT